MGTHPIFESDFDCLTDMAQTEFCHGDPFVHRADSAAQILGNKRGWSPYSWHGGSILAIAGEDFAVLASDTRLGEHGGIYTRELNRNTQGKFTRILVFCI